MTRGRFIGRHRSVEPLLTNLPLSWRVERFKGLLARSFVRNDDLSAPMMSLKSTGDVVLRSSMGQSQDPDDTSLPRYLVTDVDELVVNPMWLVGGAIGVSKVRGAVSPDYRVFTPRAEVVPRYLHYAVRSQPYIDQFALYTRAQTTFDRRVQQPDLDNLPLPVPPLDEQRAIADFLDRETARIDTLIEEQQRLIDLLRERRDAVVSKAVRTGTDPSAPLRDTGVDWLGRIPAHWQSNRLKFSNASIQTGIWGSDPGGDGDDIYCVRVADFDRPKLRVGHRVPTLRSVPEKDRGSRLLDVGDLLLEKSGGTPKNPVGFVAIFEGPPGTMVYANFLTRLRVRPQQNPRYWLYAHAASYSTRLTARSVKQTTGIQNLDQRSYFDEIFPYPPIDEQISIAAYLDDQTAKIDTLIAEAERFIELSRERRAALITAAVTGQIDVRDEVV